MAMAISFLYYSEIDALVVHSCCELVRNSRNMNVDVYKLPHKHFFSRDEFAAKCFLSRIQTLSCEKYLPHILTL